VAGRAERDSSPARGSKRGSGRSHRLRVSLATQSQVTDRGWYGFAPSCALSSCAGGSVDTIPASKMRFMHRPRRAGSRRQILSRAPLRIRCPRAVPAIGRKRATCRDRTLPRFCHGTGESLIFPGEPLGRTCQFFCWCGCSCSESIVFGPLGWSGSRKAPGSAGGFLPRRRIVPCFGQRRCGLKITGPARSGARLRRHPRRQRNNCGPVRRSVTRLSPRSRGRPSIPQTRGFSRLLRQSGFHDESCAPSRDHEARP
jgi:hypothetical protein